MSDTHDDIDKALDLLLELREQCEAHGQWTGIGVQIRVAGGSWIDLDDKLAEIERLLY